MKKVNRSTAHYNQFSFNDLNRVNKFNFIEGVLSGTTGGALIGSPMGIIGSIVVSIIGGFFTGYSSYRAEVNKIRIQKTR